MNFGFDLTTILTGVLIFFARIIDVSMGTLRTISIVQGRTRISFFLGFVEVSMWLVVISTVIQKITQKPILGLFYALGFSTGNVIGILLERRLAYGQSVLRIFSPQEGPKIADMLREAGYPVTIFQGEGGSGPVSMLYLAYARKDLKRILSKIKEIQPDTFYTVDLAGSVSKVYRPFSDTQSRWKSILKIK